MSDPVGSGDYDLRDNAVRDDVEYYAEGADVYMSFTGDGIYCFTVKSNRKNTFAQQIVDLLNGLKP